MNTFKSFFVLIAMSLTTVLVGQATINPAIQATLDGFVEASNNGDWDKAFDYMYPKMFEQVSKQDLVDLMKSTQEDGMSISMDNVKITSTSVPMEENGETFVRVEYAFDMEVDIAAGGIYDHPKATMGMEQQFQTLYGASNVKWDESGKEFNVRARKSMMAINSGDDVWKMVEINTDQTALMEHLFPASVLQALVNVE